MALRGSLKDFSLPDVLQLIGLSRKTGVLRITSSDDATGSIWFRDGEVFFAQSNWQRTKLGERLVAAQKITPSALSRVLGVHAADPKGRRIGQIFVDEGYITQSVLEAFVQEQIQDTIFDLMRWEDGEFGFDPLPAEPEEDIGLSVSIENIIMEGSRRLEEWQRLKMVIPSMDIVFRMSEAPGLSGFEISLKPAEWNLLMLIDGTRSVADLARDTGQTDFEVARVIHGLFSAGLLEIGAVEPEEVPFEAPETEPTPSEDVAPEVAEPALEAAEESALEATTEPALEATEEGAVVELEEADTTQTADHELPTVETEEAPLGIQEPASVTPPAPEPSEEEIMDEILSARRGARTGPAVEPAGAAVAVGAPSEGESGVEEQIPADEDIKVLEEEWAIASRAAMATHGDAPETLDESVEEAGVDEESEAPEEPAAESVGETPGEPTIVSTSMPRDAMDVGLGSAISDEIAALTGAARTVRTPTAAPERSSEFAGVALKRDLRVDRETVLKVIHAVEKL